MKSKFIAFIFATGILFAGLMYNKQPSFSTAKILENSQLITSDSITSWPQINLLVKTTTTYLVNSSSSFFRTHSKESFTNKIFKIPTTLTISKYLQIVSTYSLKHWKQLTLAWNKSTIAEEFRLPV